MNQRSLRFVRRELCPVCGCADPRRVYEKSFQEEPIRRYLDTWYRGRVPVSQLRDGAYVVMECPACGLLYQRDVLDDDGLALLYGTWINADASAKRSLRRAGRERRAIARQIRALGHLFEPSHRRATVVELGCGWGGWLLAARAFGYAVAGVEIDDRRREFVVAQGIPCYRTLQEVPDGTADFAYAQQVFEHLRQPREVLQSLVRLMRPGACALIAVPNARWVKANLKAAQFVSASGKQVGIHHSLNPIAPLEHVNAFAGKSLERMGELCGLSVFRSRTAFLSAHSLRGCIEIIPRFFCGIVRGHGATSILFRKKRKLKMGAPVS